MLSRGNQTEEIIEENQEEKGAELRTELEKSKLKLVPIKKDFGWCDDVRSKYYNKFVKLPFKFSAEKLYIKKNIYDIVVVIDHNQNPIKKGKGSAIFLHVAKRDYSPTLGCIALSKDKLKILISIINKNTFLKII